MDKRKALFFSIVVLWGLFVALLTVYLFFPCEKVFGIALQNMVAGNGTSFSVEGISFKLTGLKATKLRFQPDSGGGRFPVFEVSNIVVAWNPLSLFKGKFSLHARASAYGGIIQANIGGISLTTSSTNDMYAEFQNINLAELPQRFMSFKGIKGSLNGWMKKHAPSGMPERGVGSFQLNVKDGEIEELKITNLPRLEIPFKEVVLEGNTRGPLTTMNRIVMNGDSLSMQGSGTIDAGEGKPTIDLKVHYQALSPNAPLRGKGTIAISGSRTAPHIAILPAQANLGQR